MAFDLKWESDGVYAKFYGDLSTDDLIRFNSQVVGDSRFDYIRYEICDFLDVEKILGGQKETREIATVNKIASSWNNGLHIMVVTNSAYLQSQTKLYENFVKDTEWKIDIYDSLEKALEAKSEVYK